MSDHDTQGARQDAAVPEPLWDVRDCAAYLRKSERWLRSALMVLPECAGSIPHVRVGRAPRFVPGDIRAWVSMGCPPALALRESRRDQPFRRRRPETP